MRILVAHWMRAVVGGAEHQLRTVLSALAARGHDVALLHEYEPVGPDVATVDAGVAGMRRWCVQANSTLEAVAAALAWRPDVAYVHGMEDPAIERALVAAVPTVLYAHNYYGTCATGAKRFAWPDWQPCQRRFGTACLPLMYLRRCGAMLPHQVLPTLQRQLQRHALLRQYHAVLVATRHMRQEFLRHGVPAERLHVAPLFPVGVARSAVPPAPRPPSGRLAYLGRLYPDKGPQLLADAVRGAQSVIGRPLSLELAGEGPAATALARDAERAGIQATLLGWLDADARNAWLGACDALAMPSVWPEPFGLAGIEAGCLGVPAVAFSVGGIPEWLKDGVNGHLVQGRALTAVGLSEALVRVLHNPDHLQELRVGAWREAEHWSLTSHLDAVEQVLIAAGGAG